MQACGLKPSFRMFALNYLIVTPHAGVWIETRLNKARWWSLTASRLMQACGLKPWPHKIVSRKSFVTPHAGVWIETLHLVQISYYQLVTPHAGVWIETKTPLSNYELYWCHASCRRVDWNKFIRRVRMNPLSHASCRRVDWNCELGPQLEP